MAARPLSEVSVGDVVGPVTVPVVRDTLVAYANASPVVVDSSVRVVTIACPPADRTESTVVVPST